MPLDQEAVAVPVDRTTTEPNPISPADLTPPIDIYEGPEGLVLEADLPGVPDGRLSIQLEANVLSLRGRVAPLALDNARILHEEYRAGDFSRSFILSDEVDRAQISASFKHGVLRVNLPRAERARTRRIEIKTF